MSILSKNAHVILEAYYGRSKEFLTLEKELKKIITTIKQDRKTQAMFRARVDLDNLDSNITIQKILTDFFDINYIKIHWTDSGPNAYTRITSFPMMHIENANNLKKYNKFRNSDLKIYVFLDTSLITMADLNEKEILSVLLHEIGHNFDISPFRFLSSLPLLMLMPFVGIIGLAWSEADIAIDNFLKLKIPFVYNLLAYNNESSAKMNGPLMVLLNPMVIVTRIISIPTTLPHAILGYGQERFSDSFAASYGYGADLGLALYKLNNLKDSLYNKFITNTPIINVVSDFFRFTLSLIGAFSGPHPSSQTRLVNTINKLKRDLNDPNLPPDLKQELRDNISLVETTHKNILNDPDTKKNKIITYTRDMINNRIFNGKMDYREVANKIYEHYEA